jgi:molecular chaperone DnaK
MSSSFIPIVGIDLGTTNSSVACIRNGKAEIIESPQGQRMIPSVVMIDPQGKVTVGDHARSSLVAMPEHTIAAIKRRMGSGEPIHLADQSLLPHEISALILKEIKSYVDEHYGEGDKEAVITVPAYFTDEQRRATKQAGELAGFIVDRIINEPTAAALAFGLEHLHEDRHLLVYDLGGGTFDVSVVEMMSGIMEVKATTGDRHLGGEDFDWCLVDWMAEKMVAEQGVDPRDDIRGRALLKETAEKVKMDLSTQEQVSISLPLITVKDKRPIGLSTRITRKEFIALIEDTLLRTIDSIHSVLKDSELELQHIDEILLVGGSTRIPRVRELISELFNKEPRTDIHPDEAVALGAAVQAGLKSGSLSESGLIATDVAPFSMGITVMADETKGRVKPGAFAKIIHRNTTIPVTKSHRFYTSVPGQTAVSIEIYQGEHEWVKHNFQLGEFLLDGLPENFEQQEGIDVTFRYNLNGILEVTAASVTTGKEMSITVQDALKRESRHMFEESASKLQALWENIDEDSDEDFEMDVDLDELFDDDMDGTDEDWMDDKSPLYEQAKQLEEQAEKLLDSMNIFQRKKFQQMIDDFNENITSGNDEKLRKLVEEMVDLLIDLEVG